MSVDLDRRIFYKIPFNDIKTVRTVFSHADDICVEINGINAVSIKTFTDFPAKNIVFDTNVKAIQKEHIKHSKMSMAENWTMDMVKLTGWKWYWEHMTSMMRQLEGWNGCIIGFSHGKMQQRVDFTRKLDVFGLDVAVPIHVGLDSLDDLKMAIKEFDIICLEGTIDTRASCVKAALTYVSLAKLKKPGLRVICNDVLSSHHLMSFPIDSICLSTRSKSIHPVWSGMHRVAWTDAEHQALLFEANPLNNMFMFNAITNYRNLQNTWRSMPAITLGETDIQALTEFV